jgi:hypothetical protein
VNKLLTAFALAIIVAMVVILWLNGRSQKDEDLASIGPALSKTPAQQIHAHDYVAKGRVPAHYATAPDLAKLPPTLPPIVFTGNQRRAYQAAKEIPQTLAQLPCYCHCDHAIGHKSLLSCFESEHGENCGVCIGEALMAHNLSKQGVAVSEIRKRIIAAYGD